MSSTSDKEAGRVRRDRSRWGARDAVSQGYRAQQTRVFALQQVCVGV